MTELARETAKKGYVYFDWNCASGDATGNGIPAYKLVENVKATDPGSRNIVVLMHDAYGKKTTPESLPGIIEYFSERGYSFGVLTENVPPVHHKIAN